jgi:hypothetical protein
VKGGKREVEREKAGEKSKKSYSAASKRSALDKHYFKSKGTEWETQYHRVVLNNN